MDIFGADPATMRTIACAQLGFAALFFVLTARVIPTQRALPLWALSNLVAIMTLVLDGFAMRPGTATASVMSSLGMISTMTLIWWGLRTLHGLAMPWRAISACALSLGFACIIITLYAADPVAIIYPILFHVTAGIVLLVAARDFIIRRKDLWTAQTWLMAGSAIGWAVLTIATGLVQLAVLAVASLADLVDVMNIAHDTSTMFIVMALNFCGFLLLSEKLSEELQLLASLDSLTGVLNRRAFRSAAQGVMRTPERNGHLLVLDLDHFKRINDRYGHAAGDEVLRRFTDVLGNAIRGSDLVGRTGGEEFCVLLPCATEQEAQTVAERIREQVAAIECPWNDGVVTVTVSIGIAPLKGMRDLDHATADADKALYAAKRLGRNRVISIRSLAEAVAGDAAGRAGASDAASGTPSIDTVLNNRYAASA